MGDVFQKTSLWNGHIVAAKHMLLFFMPWELRNNPMEGCQTGPKFHIIVTTHMIYHLLFQTIHYA